MRAARYRAAQLSTVYSHLDGKRWRKPLRAYDDECLYRDVDVNRHADARNLGAGVDHRGSAVHRSGLYSPRRRPGSDTSAYRACHVTPARNTEPRFRRQLRFQGNARGTRRPPGLAGAQGDRTCGSQSVEANSRARTRAALRPERQPLLPSIQMRVWRIAPRLCAAAAHPSGPGTDADHLGTLELDRRELRHVRSAALHPLIPPHRRRDALHVAPYPPRLAERRVILFTLQGAGKDIASDAR